MQVREVVDWRGCGRGFHKTSGEFTGVLRVAVGSVEKQGWVEEVWGGFSISPELHRHVLEKLDGW